MPAVPLPAPSADAGVPTPKRLAGALAALDERAAAGRTGTVVGCHLRRHFGLSGNEALARIAEEWKGVAKSHRTLRSPETAERAASGEPMSPFPSPVGSGPAQAR